MAQEEVKAARISSGGLTGRLGQWRRGRELENEGKGENGYISPEVLR